MTRAAILAQMLVAAGCVAAAMYMPVPIYIWMPIACFGGLWIGGLFCKLLHPAAHRQHLEAVVVGFEQVLNAAGNVPIITPHSIASTAPGAEDRSMSLFEGLLSPEQLLEWRRDKKVSVPLPNGQVAVLGESFRITWPDISIAQCVHPISTVESGRLPQNDTLVHQLLWLRNNPNALRKIGALSPLPGVVNGNQPTGGLDAVFRRLADPGEETNRPSTVPAHRQRIAARRLI